MARKVRFSYYDLMDENGVFEQNPNNACSPQYKGPAEYPKMLYHPKGEMRVTQRAEILATPMGPKEVGEQRELINRVVNDEVEEKEWVEKGWHRHPRDAIAASGKEPPPVAVSRKPEDLEEQIRRLTAELAQARKLSVKVA